ncbi:hypothetical protein ACLB9X_06220 [Streptomyces sp. 5K101]|uniref:hypothetical protein n=1 Tax=Streptomyces sp. 5K101 TaxID=3390037 RepID=UPI00397546F3
MAQDSAHRAAAVELVKYLTTTAQMLKNADAFGVMPSRTSGLAEYAKKNPSAKAWADARAYAQGPVTVAGFDKVLTQFNTDLAALRTGDPKKILADLQRNGEQALAKGHSAAMSPRTSQHPRPAPRSRAGGGPRTAVSPGAPDTPGGTGPAAAPWIPTSCRALSAGRCGSAAALLSTLPVAVLFFCFQRYFVQGANSGAVKE